MKYLKLFEKFEEQICDRCGRPIDNGDTYDSEYGDICKKCFMEKTESTPEKTFFDKLLLAQRYPEGYVMDKKDKKIILINPNNRTITYKYVPNSNVKNYSFTELIDNPDILVEFDVFSGNNCLIGCDEETDRLDINDFALKDSETEEDFNRRIEDEYPDEADAWQKASYSISTDNTGKIIHNWNYEYAFELNGVMAYGPAVIVNFNKYEFFKDKNNSNLWPKDVNIPLNAISVNWYKLDKKNNQWVPFSLNN